MGLGFRVQVSGESATLWKVPYSQIQYRYFRQSQNEQNAVSCGISTREEIEYNMESPSHEDSGTSDRSSFEV